MSYVDELLDGYPLTLTVDQLMELLGVSKATIYAWLRNGEIPAMRIGSPRGGTWVIYREEVRTWMHTRRNIPKDES